MSGTGVHANVAPAAPAAPAAMPANVQDPPFVLPDSVELRTDVLYARHGGQDLYLDLFLPREAGTGRRAVVYIHGGGWRGGNRRQFWRQAAHMATLDCVGATVQYRLTPQFPFPAAVEDVQEAVLWLRRHAGELGIGANRIGAAGGSAGGHLAAMLGTIDAPVGDVSSRVQAVVACNGVFDFPTLSTPAAAGPRAAFLGSDPEVAVVASPLRRADEHAAPALLVHGTADSTVPFEQSVAFQRRLQELGIRADLYAEPEAAHGFFNRTPYYQRTLLVMERFLLEVL